MTTPHRKRFTTLVACAAVSIGLSSPLLAAEEKPVESKVVVTPKSASIAAGSMIPRVSMAPRPATGKASATVAAASKTDRKSVV